jgi:excisionase family DNA binding protein
MAASSLNLGAPEAIAAKTPAPKETAAPPLAVRLPEAARLLSISERFAANLIASGKIRSLRVGKVRLIPVTAIDEFLNGENGGGAR